MSATAEPFFHRDGDTFVPTRMANGFWGPKDNLHARVMIGLFAHVIEQQDHNRLIRPRADYVGPKRRPFVPVAKR